VSTATKILVIDPDPRIQEAASLVLSSHGYTVTGAQDGADGMRDFHANPPNIVIVEILMPDKCGIEIIREISRLRTDTRIIAMSAGGRKLRSDYLLDVAFKLGASGVLVKPFGAEELLEVVKAVLPNHAHVKRVPPNAEW
jgi:DNA-binding response OmpR family regulator